LPAGTVHAVGGGVLMTEVQQTSDATFRLFDWNRRDAQGKSRTLHIEESLAAIDWSLGPVQPVRASGWEQKSGMALPSPAIRQSLVKCPFFELDYVEPKQPATLGDQGRLQLLIVLRGSGKITSAHGEESLDIGQAWVLPADMKAWECRPGPELAYLHCTLP
jgi:mannose-6-phosphate isomerase